MDPTVRELVLLALISAFLCGVALISAEPIATVVFAALTSGCVVIAAGLSRGSWTCRRIRVRARGGHRP
jgi:hypothetical protein